jgi:hypothetical protein
MNTRMPTSCLLHQPTVRRQPDPPDPICWVRPQLEPDSADEFLVEVAAVDASPDEVYYSLRHLADLAPGVYEPAPGR